MKDDSLWARLREASWRGKMTPDQEAQLRSWLEAHPEDKEAAESDAALNSVLSKLPSAHVPSNFTARVVAAAVREMAAGGRRDLGWASRFRRLRWAPKLAFATIVFSAGLFAYHEIHQARLGEIRQSLITISEVPSLANPEILQDFEAIQVMSQTPSADEDLIRLLQ